MINQYTELYGVIGNPIKHSLGPIMHNAAFSQKGINAVYLAFESDDIESAVKGMRSLGIKGMSITIPFKSTVMPFLDEIDPLAKEIGAVNTVVNRDNRLIGYNTDASGALKALEEAGSVTGKTCIIVGAGGAARAIGFILKKNNVNLIIANRSIERGRELSSSLDAGFIQMEQLSAVKADILINTTPVGMSPNVDVCPVPENALRSGMTVMDIIYNPKTTRLLQLAISRGCRIVEGINMFIYQGALQFRLWTGKDAPVDVMKKVVKEYLYNG